VRAGGVFWREQQPAAAAHAAGCSPSAPPYPSLSPPFSSSSPKIHRALPEFLCEFPELPKPAAWSSKVKPEPVDWEVRREGGRAGPRPTPGDAPCFVRGKSCVGSQGLADFARTCGRCSRQAPPWAAVISRCCSWHRTRRPDAWGFLQRAARGCQAPAPPLVRPAPTYNSQALLKLVRERGAAVPEVSWCTPGEDGGRDALLVRCLAGPRAGTCSLGRELPAWFGNRWEPPNRTSQAQTAASLPRWRASAGCSPQPRHCALAVAP
jgi:hypothetical protein